MPLNFPNSRAASLLRLLAMLSGVLFTLTGCNWITLVTQSSNGTLAESGGGRGKPSADGRFVVFASHASNLVPGDTNNEADIFVRDTALGTTTRVSVNSAGDESNKSSFGPTISGDGRFVAFGSLGTNLVAYDTNNSQDVFVHDRDTGITRRISVSSTGVQADSDSDSAFISNNGRYVAFRSIARNLVANDNFQRDIYVHDRNTGSTTRASANMAGVASNGTIYGGAVISSDGRYVAFGSTANDLVANDTNEKADVFVRDRVAGITTRVSVSSSGNEAVGGESSVAGISGDGRFVVFNSNAFELIPNDFSGSDVFVHDRVTRSTTRVNLDHAGRPVLGAYGGSISGDGRYVVFSTDANIGNDINFYRDIYIHDRKSGTTTRVSLDARGNPANSGSESPVISYDGRYVVFESFASNLTPGDTNGQWHIFIRAVPNISVTSVLPKMLPKGATTAVTITGTNFLPGSVPNLGNAQLSNIVVVNEKTITLRVYVPSNKPTGAQNASVSLLGTGPGPINGAMGVCTNCITFF